MDFLKKISFISLESMVVCIYPCISTLPIIKPQFIINIILVHWSSILRGGEGGFWWILLWFKSIKDDIPFWKSGIYCKIICQKNCTFAKNIYCHNKLLSKKMCKNQKRRNMIDFTFLKTPWHGKSKFATKKLQNFQKINFYSRKTENVQILFKGICAKIYENFRRKNCAICFLCSRLSKEL